MNYLAETLKFVEDRLNPRWESEDEKWNDKLYTELHPEQFDN